MVAIALFAASLCLAGGEQVDLSAHIASTVRAIELKATMDTAKGVLIIYSPGQENKPIELTSKRPTGRLSISKPILCVKATGGPFDFDIEAKPIPSFNASVGAFKFLFRGPGRKEELSRERKYP
jgi:hypothetical protein